MNNTAILDIVREGFEEQKGIKILSLFFSEEKRIEGIYIIPPEQSLSFVKLPLLDMFTEFEGYKIFLIELGEILRYSYKMGSLFHFNQLLVSSEINYVNNSFDKIINFCKEHPPLLLIKTNLIEWIEKTDEIDEIKMLTFLQQCEYFNKIDKLDYNKNLSVENIGSINNQMNYVKQQLKEKKYNKISELVINEIDKLFIQTQIDLYITDDKKIYKNV